MRVADYVVSKIAESGVDKLFVVTGRGMLYLSDALAKHKDINGVFVHHEQAGAYAAMAYSQISQKIGACMVSTGCASTNAITPILCAWQDDIPMIVISGQNKLNETTRYTRLPIRTYGQQEADIVSLVKPITKYATMIIKAEEIVFEMEKALYMAMNGRKGPVWIDIPLDIQSAQIELNKVKHFEPINKNLFVSQTDLNDVIDKLYNSKRPLILFGSGIRSANAIEELKTLIMTTEIPAVYANSAVDILDSRLDLLIGCVGAMAANRAANFAIQNADLIIVLGCRMTTLITGENLNNFAREADIITIDIDEFEHKKLGNKIQKQIIVDVKHFIQTLLGQKLPKTKKEWQEKCQHYKQTFPKCEERFKQNEQVDLYHLSEILETTLNDDAICVVDAGLEELIIPTTINFKERQRCIHPVSQGAMGYALPAAMGAFLVSNRQVVAIIGDGSIMMNLQELQTINHNNIPIKILVINNNCYAVIRRRQEELFRRSIGTDFKNGVSCPDFKKVASCFGFEYKKINSTNELKTLKDILKIPKHLICEIMAKEDQIYIHSSYRRGENGKFMQPPIEDQSPFIDRVLFKKEMIIKPIE